MLVPSSLSFFLLFSSSSSHHVDNCSYERTEETEKRVRRATRDERVELDLMERTTRARELGGGAGGRAGAPPHDHSSPLLQKPRRKQIAYKVAQYNYTYLHSTIGSVGLELTCWCCSL